MDVVRVDRSIFEKRINDLAKAKDRIAELEIQLEGMDDTERAELMGQVDRLQRQVKYHKGRVQHISYVMVKQWNGDSVAILETLRQSLREGNISNDDAAITLDLVINHLTRNEV